MPRKKPNEQQAVTRQRPRPVNFGGWVKSRLKDANVSVADLSRETGISYPSLSNMLNGSDGKVSRQDADTVEKIAASLVRLKVIETEAEAWVAGGFMADGYKVVKERALMSLPPENFSDWPPELQEALGFVRDMQPEVQKYIFLLWREQARSHHELETRRREAERKLEERERLIQASKN